MNIDQVKYVYFVGIGGIGMSALARFFKTRQCEVYGYDRTETALTRSLQNEGIMVQYVDDSNLLPDLFNTVSDQTLVIYTPAIPSDSAILNRLKTIGHVLHKRSQVLGLLSRGHYTIAVAGTHGKTTTSTMVAHILMDSGHGCSAFLGGISTNYHTNTLIGDNNVLVVEADEYDRSFLTLYPDVAIVTSADADHLDIYGDHDQMTASFEEFLSQVSPSGVKIVHAGLPFLSTITYGLDSDVRHLSKDGVLFAYAENVQVKDGYFYFDYKSTTVNIENIRLGLPGRHNIRNAVAAMTAALGLNIDPLKVKSALANFAGVKRRFEFHVRTDKHTYIDDYAHHPTEINAFVDAVKELYPDRKLTLIFQPHLFTRTRDFMDGFAEALAKVDTLLLMEIYPAREQPIPGITSGALLEMVDLSDKRICSEIEVLTYVKEVKPELLVTVGAGNIDRLVEPLRELMENV